MTWWIIAFDGPIGEPTIIGRVYRGYSISAAGSLIGMVWAFVDGLLGGAIFAWVYNHLARHTIVSSPTYSEIERASHASV